jgi:hypothetical protein
MPDTFVPLPRPAASATEKGFAPSPLKIFSQPSNPSATNASCGEPRLSLQRDGDKITSVHIECACGQVIDLACEY